MTITDLNIYFTYHFLFSIFHIEFIMNFLDILTV